MLKRARWIVADLTSIATGAGAGQPPQVATAALMSRFLLSAQKMANPNRSMFERIFLRGESQAEVVKSLGLTRLDYQQMLRVLAASTQ